jgi:hypothetical protein
LAFFALGTFSKWSGQLNAAYSVTSRDKAQCPSRGIELGVFSAIAITDNEHASYVASSWLSTSVAFRRKAKSDGQIAHHKFINRVK